MYEVGSLHTSDIRNHLSLFLSHHGSGLFTRPEAAAIGPSILGLMREFPELKDDVETADDIKVNFAKRMQCLKCPQCMGEWAMLVSEFEEKVATKGDQQVECNNCGESRTWKEWVERKFEHTWAIW